MRRRLRKVVAERLYWLGWCWVDVGLWSVSARTWPLWRARRQSGPPCYMEQDGEEPCMGCRRQFPEVTP